MVALEISNYNSGLGCRTHRNCLQISHRRVDNLRRSQVLTCQTESIASAATRTLRKRPANQPGKSRSARTIPSAPGPSRCPAAGRYLAVPNAGHCCKRWMATESVPNVASNCTPANNAFTLIPPAVTSALNPYLNGSSPKIPETNARFIQCASWLKKKQPPQPWLNLWTPARLLRIYSRSKTGN